MWISLFLQHQFSNIIPPWWAHLWPLVLQPKLEPTWGDNAFSWPAVETIKAPQPAGWPHFADCSHCSLLRSLGLQAGVGSGPDKPFQQPWSSFLKDCWPCFHMSGALCILVTQTTQVHSFYSMNICKTQINILKIFPGIKAKTYFQESSILKDEKPRKKKESRKALLHTDNFYWALEANWLLYYTTIL